MSSNDSDRNPEPYEIDGKIGEVGELVEWDGDLAFCATCCLPGEVTIEDVDRNDVNGSYYVTNDTLYDCCGARWVKASALHRDVSLPAEALLAKELRNAIISGDIMLSEIRMRTEELFRVLAQPTYNASTKPFKGTCSACFTDVVLVGGVVEHEDKRTCSTPAILLS